MLRLLALTGLVFGLLCGQSGRAAAADAQVRYLVTNGGTDVRGKAQVTFYPAGKHDGPSVTWGSPDDTLKLPEGTYNVHLTFADGAARKEIWFDNQSFSGSVEKKVELALPVTEVRYRVTNGGQDVRGQAQVTYFPPGKHDGPSITWASSGDAVRMPEGSYNVHLTFSDGAAKKELWFDNQGFAGTVEKTIELGVAITEVRYRVTNGGQDVHGQAQVTYFPPGKHDGPSITWASSGDSVRMPQGSYNVHLTFSDGAARKELWFDNQSFSGQVEKTVELGVAITAVRYLVTNNGEDVHGKAQVTYFPAGKHDGPSVTWASSGDTVRMPAGTYNVHLTFSDGSAKKDEWFDNQDFAGTVDRSVEVATRVAEVRYRITNGGADVQSKGQVTYFPAGRHDGPSVTWANSDGAVRIPEGVYNVHVTFEDGSAKRDKWLDNQSFTGTEQRTVEIGVAVAEVRYRITNGGVDLGDKATATYFPAGRHDGPSVTWAISGGAVRLPEGAYDVQIAVSIGLVDKRQWLDGQSLTGSVEKTVELGLTLAEPIVTVTQNGVDVGSAAQVTFIDPARNHVLGNVRGGEPTVVEAGTYDIRAVLGSTTGWLHTTQVGGKPHLTIALEQPNTQLRVTAMRDGTPVAGTWCGIYPPGKDDGAPLSRADNGAWQEVAPAAYDIGCTIAEAGGTLRAWLRDRTLAPGKTELRLDLLPAPRPTLALAQPAAKPEAVDPQHGDFPYLPSLPGSRPLGGSAADAPVYVQLPDARQPELVASHAIAKRYQAPPGVSVGDLLGLYHDALLRAGWTIVSQMLHPGAVDLTGHYGGNGRNIWAFIHIAGDGYGLTVADATIVAEQLAAELGSKCHLALTGVLFDFDKSTLKPESTPVLEQVSAMLRQDAALRLDVQGHTDGVGGDAYNQRLSESRARAVLVWLTQHGVMANRLTAHGFGKTRPIASNSTEEGRARNRRVEIANLACAR